MLGESEQPNDLRPSVAVQRAGVTVTAETQLMESLTSEWQGVQESRATSVGTGALIPGTTVLIGDSFSPTTHRLLAPFFEHLVTIWLARAIDENGEINATEILDRRPDRIVLEQVTRMFHTHPANREQLFNAAEAFLDLEAD